MSVTKKDIVDTLQVTLRSTLADTPVISNVEARAARILNDGESAAELTAYESDEPGNDFVAAPDLDISLGSGESAFVPSESFPARFLKFVSDVDNLPVRIVRAS